MPVPPIGWGAVESLAWDYTCALRRLGHDVLIINEKPPSPEAMVRIIDFNPDFVHVHYDGFFAFAADLAPRVKAIGITSHYDYIEQRARWAHDSFEPTFKGCTQDQPPKVVTVALSPGISHVFSSADTSRRRRTFLAPNGARPDAFRFTLTPLHATKSICLGKIEPRKRQQDLVGIESVWFAGNIDTAREIFATHPRYLGHWTKEQLYGELTEYGNLVLLSDGEADPLVVKEALMCGLGVVLSTYAAANIDATLPFITVLSDAERRNDARVRDAIEANRSVAVTQRQCIRDYALATFSWDVLVPKYVENIRALIDRGDGENGALEDCDADAPVIGAFYPCFMRPAQVVRSFRAHYPHAPLVLINDGDCDFTHFARTTGATLFNHERLQNGASAMVVSNKGSIASLLARWWGAFQNLRDAGAFV